MSVIIIAEIGTAHGGSLHKARDLINAAVDAGADYVKFQWVYADEILHPNTGFVNLPGGAVPLYKRFQELEVSPDFFAQAQEYTHSKHAGFICSPFGLKSLSELLAIQPDAVKIASPELNHYPLLHALSKSAHTGIPVILSSGVSRLSDIERALDLLDTFRHSCSQDKTNQTVNKIYPQLPALSLLHCITAYPAPESQYNVRLVRTLSNIFGIPTGISDHSMDPVLVPSLSVLCGGTIIEKHITLSRKTDGLDDPVALEPAQFEQMTKYIRHIEEQIAKYGSTCAADCCTEELNEKYGAEAVSAALGTGIKFLAPDEQQNYGRTNRSLHFTHSLSQGSVITADDIAVLRTEKILTPGISPEYLEIVTGARLAVSVNAGDGVRWEQLLHR